MSPLTARLARAGIDTGLPHRLLRRAVMALAKTPAATAVAPSPLPGFLAPLAQALAPRFAAHDQAAVAAANRYRSAFWLSYALSAVAVLLAVLPLSVPAHHALHEPVAVAAGVTEFVLILAIIALYRRGNSRGWRDRWVRERAVAEQLRYLPLLAPFAAQRPDGDDNWYLRLLGPQDGLPHDAAAVSQEGLADVAAQCRSLQSLPAWRELFRALDDAGRRGAYAGFVAQELQRQAAYHDGVAAREAAFAHRVHRLGTGLFMLTAAAVGLHLVVHLPVLVLLATGLPALASALHGILAHGESRRLAAGSRRQARALRALQRELDALRAAEPLPDAIRLAPVVLRAVQLLLDEHLDWRELVLHHDLPLP
ncbi:hypothetical protein [Pelomonas cellulosilytica]|uniref:DUF4231 domain-containing protein n=1 Tax=Pelomonas cellulosilytica TaxID=2906762 RepID=A0ABS8XXY2_9BURK|nr:hypothetical protein [Pelomonas sp. P8]MCE4555702.1 hypothetical protein [Pelomonas sp. P8]